MLATVKAYFSTDRKFISSLQNLLGFTPKNITLYKLAFSHRSFAEQHKSGIKLSNERLEYLGDAILGAVVAELLFKKFPYREEGFLTEMRSKIVNREHLNKLALKLGINQFMRDSIDGITKNKSAYGDALEALIGAAYMDKGWITTRKMILDRMIKHHVDIDELEIQDKNFKSRLINYCQREKINVEFELVEEIENAGRKLLRVRILLNGDEAAVTEDYSRKKADQNAAMIVCEKLKILT